MSSIALSPTAVSRHAINPWFIAGIVVLPTFMEILDTTVANVALRYMAGGLSSAQSDAEWIITSYLAANAIVLPITGWLSAHLGRRNYFLLSVAIFTLASAACGFATSLPQMILFRVIQGLSGGGLQPCSQGILMDSFPPEKQGTAMTLFGLAAIIAPVVGPTLGGWLCVDYNWRWIFFVNVPMGLVALVGAYFLARVSLTPLRAMADRISAIAPDDLDQRLPVRKPADELDALAEQFNQLLERLKSAQAQNRQFLARAAHQLRTPLTVIRGESSLALERARTPEEYHELLKRVTLAADQMSHRVNELFLLARAEAGDKPPLTDHIELDGLVLECVDLMRGRAAVLGRRLDLGTMDHAEVVGNEPLIREAVLELLENACRHGVASQPIRIATFNGTEARVEVASSGAPAPGEPAVGGDGTRMGLAIVRWIAGTHGGRLTHRYADGANVFSLELKPAKSPN